MIDLDNNNNMRKWCPNYDNEDGLETVLEIPVPEEMFANMGSNSIMRWQNMRNLMKTRARGEDSIKSSSSYAVPFLRNDQFMLLLKLIGSALIPYHVQFGRSVNLPINDGSIVSPFPLPMFRIFISLQNFVSVLEN